MAIVPAAGGLVTAGHGPLSQPASAADLLRRAAAAPGPAAPRPDQFIFVESTSVQLLYPLPPPSTSGRPIRIPVRDGRLMRFTMQTWTSVNGTREGLVREQPRETGMIVHNRLMPGSKVAACEYSVSWGVLPGQAQSTPEPAGYLRMGSEPADLAGGAHALPGRAESRPGNASGAADLGRDIRPVPGQFAAAGPPAHGNL